MKKKRTDSAAAGAAQAGAAFRFVPFCWAFEASSSSSPLTVALPSPRLGACFAGAASVIAALARRLCRSTCEQPSMKRVRNKTFAF